MRSCYFVKYTKTASRGNPLKLLKFMENKFPLNRVHQIGM